MYEYLRPTQGQPGWEDVEGSMECYRCFEKVLSARYNKAQKLLLYVCSQGHQNKMEDMTL